jgi:hypothetical protein
MRYTILLSILFLLLFTNCLSIERTVSFAEQIYPSDSDEDYSIFLPLMTSNDTSTGCVSSRLGSILFTEPTRGESTGPYLEDLAQEGYTGLVGTPTYNTGAEFFGKLPGWDRLFICNSHECLEQRAQRASNEGVDYEYLSYGPERLGGVPPEEKYNLPWATQVAREIADQWNKPLVISYSTKQLHQEAEERGYGWEDPSLIIAMLAPYGDIWMIQAADEYWRLDDGTIRPILSQRVYPPGEEFRAQVEKWVRWIRAANPEIQIWIQLGLQRIGVDGENEPSSDLVMEYRKSILDLVDGIYLTPIYGSIEQFPIANQEMVEVFHQACAAPAVQPAAKLTPSFSNNEITLVEEGWTDNLTLPCPPSGDCLTVLRGYYYRIYENSKYPCGSQGNHQFMVLDNHPDTTIPEHLFVKFPGGGVGFWYLDQSGQATYYPNDRATGLLTSDYFRNMFFRTSVSEEYAAGVTKKFRENPNFRMVAPSYCSHDLYMGTGEYNEVDDFYRWGYSAAMSAVDYVQQNFNTMQLITYGGSAGASGSFYIGKDQENVAAIIMDSQAADLSAISVACYDGLNVFGNAYPCFCPEGGPTCMEVFAPRIGFTFFMDEPYKFIETGFNRPIYYVWNERDASIYAYLQFEKLHEAIEKFNPAGDSIANRVCVTDPRTPPGPECNLHVPSAYDFPVTEQLVEEIYQWALSQVRDEEYVKLFVPFVIH